MTPRGVGSTQSKMVNRKSTQILPLASFTHLLGGQTKGLAHKDPRSPCGVRAPYTGGQTRTPPKNEGGGGDPECEAQSKGEVLLSLPTNVYVPPRFPNLSIEIVVP